MYFLLPRFGIDGYFVSFALTHALNFTLSLRKVLQIGGVRMRGFFAVMTPAVAIFSVFGGSCFTGPVRRMAAFLGLFLGLCLYTGVLGKGDIRWLKGLIFDGRKTVKTADTIYS